jgi:hypothetical protein
MEECVQDPVYWDAGVSITQVGEELNVLHIAIWKVLHEQLLHPYHLQGVQGLMSRQE